MWAPPTNWLAGPRRPVIAFRFRRPTFLVRSPCLRRHLWLLRCPPAQLPLRCRGLPLFCFAVLQSASRQGLRRLLAACFLRPLRCGLLALAVVACAAYICLICCLFCASDHLMADMGGLPFKIRRSADRPASLVAPPGGQSLPSLTSLFLPHAPQHPQNNTSF